MTEPGYKSRVRALAERQYGRVTWAQLRLIGVADSTVGAWIDDEYLKQVLPRVYALGHCAPSMEAGLMAAVLYAGPDAMLSHASAAWWLGLIDENPRAIQVTTPRRCRSRPGIRVYARRERERFLHKSIPVTSYPEILIDLAATTSRRTLRKALANADYQGVLDLDAIEEATKRGFRGATKLRKALAEHQPKLAYTKSELEIMIVELCEREGIPVPLINEKLEGGWEPDAYWPEAKLVVELDGRGNHHTPAQIKRDRRKEMAFRGMGLTVIRYTGDQLKFESKAVAEELRQLTTQRPHPITR